MPKDQTVLELIGLVIFVIVVLVYRAVKNYFFNKPSEKINSIIFHRRIFCIKHDYRLIALLLKTKGVMIKCTKCSKTKSIYIDEEPHNGGGIWADREYLDDEKWNKIMKFFKEV